MALEPPETVAAGQPSELLGAKLTALRGRLLTVHIGTGSALAVVVGVELLGLSLFLDWWVELPWGVRLFSLLAQLAILAWILARFVLIPLLRQPSDDDLALIVERSKLDFGQRLIAAVQLSRPGGLEAGASPALAKATIHQAERLAQSFDFRQIVPVAKARRLGWLAAAVLLLGLACLPAGGNVTRDLLRRAFLSSTPVPRKTRVLVESGDKRIGRGDDVRLQAVAEGVIPDRGRVELRRPGRRTQRFDMEPVPAEVRRFGRSLQNVQESFDYVIFLNDGRSDLHRVEVRPRPTVRTIATVQSFPAYTGRQTLPRPVSDLSLLAGSQLQVHIEASQPVASGQLRFVGTNVSSPVELAVDPSEAERLSGAFGVPRDGLAGFTVELMNTEGMASRDEVVYRVQILPDRIPEVRLTYPERKEELMTRGAQLLVGIDASDDFALSALRLSYRSDREDTVKHVDLELDGAQPARIERRFRWDLVGPGFSEGTLIEFWAEATDNNDVTGPGVGRSGSQVVRIVSENEKRADLLNRAGDIFSSIADATEDQEELNRRLGEIILEKTGP